MTFTISYGNLLDQGHNIVEVFEIYEPLNIPRAPLLKPENNYRSIEE